MFGIPLSHLLFEVVAYILFFVCLSHALKQNSVKERLAILITGTVYGVLLETMTIYQLHAYVYGDFLVMFNGEVPLVIGVGWGIILYSVIAIADALKLSFFGWVASVGLLGLAIDATMDVAAIRIGMWNWRNKGALPGVYFNPSDDWFGVALANYYAWFIVLTSVALFMRLFKINECKSIKTIVLKSVGAMVASLIVLGVLDGLYVEYANHTWWPIIVEISFALIVITYSLVKKSGSIRDNKVIKGLPSFIVPAFFHIYFTAVLVWAIFQPSIIEREDMRAVYMSQLPVFFSVAVVLMIITYFVHRKASKI